MPMPSGYRQLHWKQNDVITPHYMKIDGIYGLSFHIVEDYDDNTNHDNHNNNVYDKLNSNHNNNSNFLNYVHFPTKLEHSQSVHDDLLCNNNYNNKIDDKLENTSNEAYFIRHYRAEMREKLFYDDFFKSRCREKEIREKP